MDQLYMLEWYNGLEFDDAETTLLGIYTSREERAVAEQRYRDSDMEYFPFCGCANEGKFVKWEVEVNKDLLLPR